MGLVIDWLQAFLSFSVTVGGIMVEALKRLFQYSSHVLAVLHFVFSFVRTLLLWAVDITWLVTGVVINLSFIVGGVLIQCLSVIWQTVVITMKYCVYGISFLPNLFYSFVTQGSSVVMSMATSSLYFLQQSFWPLIVHCVTYMLSFISNAAIFLYDMLCVLCEYAVLTVLTIVQFSQDAVLPCMITICNGLFHILLTVVDYCYTTIITIIYYLTKVTLQVAELLPGTVTTDLINYIFESISAVISAIFDILSHFIRSCFEVVELVLTSPAFWTILMIAIILTSLFSWLNRNWSNRWPAPLMVANPHPVVTAEERRDESQEGRRRVILNSVAAHQSNVATAKGDNDAMKKVEKLEEEMLCVVCQGNKKNILLQPCNHVCLCPSCITEVMRLNGHCPLCRNRISKWTKVYL